MEIHPTQYVRGEEHARAAAGSHRCAWCARPLAVTTNDPTAPTGVRKLGEIESGLVKAVMNVFIWDEYDHNAPPEEEEKLCYFCSPNCASEAAQGVADFGGINSKQNPENHYSIANGECGICECCGDKYPLNGDYDDNHRWCSSCAGEADD